MATAALIPVSEYLRTTYDPDCDYVDGELEERTVGERSHGVVQGLLFALFLQQSGAWGVVPVPELRVQVRADRFRIPDVCILRASDPPDEIVVVPPLLCIEVLSSDDRLSRVLAKTEEFLAMGVQSVWVVDPWLRKGYVAETRSLQEPADGVLRVPGTPIAVALPELFAQMESLGVSMPSRPASPRERA